MKDHELYCMKFNPIYKQKTWGGTNIKEILKRDVDLPTIGESWEISTVDNNQTIIKNGLLKGKTLKEAIAQFKEKLVGFEIYSKYNSDFPLLIKFIDAREPLSVQVHPNDEYARKYHDAYGKSEMWYILRAKPNSKINLGFNKALGKKVVDEIFKSNQIENYLNDITVKSSDSFFVQAGKVHSIGANIFLLEIQQSSDITYRIFDYDRIDTVTNKKRELHKAQALNVIDFNASIPNKNIYSRNLNVQNQLCHTPYFKSNIWFINETINKNLCDFDCFIILICLEGKCMISCNNQNTQLIKGETVLIPAAMDKVSIIPINTVELIEVYI